MKPELAKRASDLCDEINELKEYKLLVKTKDTTHFEIREHYGDSSKQIRINRRHNDRLFVVIDHIIAELETQLESL